MKFTELKECPYCGWKIFYEKEKVEGVIRRYFTNDKNSEQLLKLVNNENMYDDLTTTSTNGYYCENCDKKVGDSTTETVTKQALSKLKKSTIV